MKRFTWIPVVVLGAALAITGCGNKGRVSTSELQSSFKSSDPSMQSLVDKTVSAVKAGNYPEALNNLESLAKKAKLTPDQQQAVNDTIAAVQKQISDMATKAASDAQKSASDLQKSLPK